MKDPSRSPVESARTHHFLSRVVKYGGALLVLLLQARAGSRNLQKFRKQHLRTDAHGELHSRETENLEICLKKKGSSKEEKKSDVELWDNGDPYVKAESATFVALLKACAQKKDLLRGARLHADILQRGLLQKSPFVASNLVSMYAKSGALAKACKVLLDLPVRGVVAWNALISAYAQQGQAEEALNCFEVMQHEPLSPDEVTFSCILKACASIKAIEKGEQIHDEVVRQGLLGKNIVIGNALVDMYAKCGALAKAQQVLDELGDRDVITWSALIAGYAKQGQCEKALICYDRVQNEGVSPNAVTFISLLMACGNKGAFERGMQIHDEIIKQGLLGQDTMLGTALVDMYAKCGDLARAAQVLYELPCRSEVTWNALITGYSQHCQAEEALNCFGLMQREGLSPDATTFIYALNACGSIKATETGKEIHLEIVRRAMLDKDIALGNALTGMYARCGAVTVTEEVLDELHFRDVVTWNSVMAGYVQQGYGEEALSCFEHMQYEGLCPDASTFVCALKACGNIRAVHKGRQLHDEIKIQDLLSNNVLVGGALIDMYAKCGAFSEAEQVLYELPVRDIVPWSALIAGYVQHGQGKEALACCERIENEGLSPNAVTFICLLKACGSIGAADKGEQLHNEIVSQDLLSKDLMLGNALVDMYAKCGVLSKAQEEFDRLLIRDVVSWSALVTGYALQGHGEQALYCFDWMQHEGVPPNVATFAGILNACSGLGAMNKGKEIHGEIICQGLAGKDDVLGNALVDMYAKCGALVEAQGLLDKLPVRSVVAWSALIGGYAQEGLGKEAIQCFECMLHEGLSPNTVSFTCLLNACTCSGLINESRVYMTSMIHKYGITPGIEHHTCMVDLFSRMGYFDKAVSMIQKMSYSDVLPIWSALLGACLKWGNVKIGRWAFENALLVDKEGAELYTSMANIYAAAGMLKEADEIESLRLEML